MAGRCRGVKKFIDYFALLHTAWKVATVHFEAGVAAIVSKRLRRRRELYLSHREPQPSGLATERVP